MSFIVAYWCNMCFSRQATQAIEIPAGESLPAGIIHLCPECFGRLEAAKNE